MRAEDNQPDPYLLFTITDADGEVVRHIKAPAKKGLKRLVWDFRYNTPAPVTGRFTPAPDQLFGGSELGHLALAGTYNVAVFKYEDGVLSPLAGPVSFQTKSLNNATLPAKDQRDYLDFCKKISALRKAASAASSDSGRR